MRQVRQKIYFAIYPYSKQASVKDSYKDSPKLLKAKNLTVFVSSLIKSIVTVIPL